MTHSHNGSLVSPSDHKAFVEPLEPALGLSCAIGRLAKKRAHVDVVFAGTTAFSLPGALLVARTHPSPGTKTILASEPAHVHTDLRKQHCCTQHIKTRNGLKKLPFFLVRLHCRDDLAIDQRHLPLEPFDMPQDLLQDQSMPITDFALQRQLQSILFLLQPPQGLFGYLLRRGAPFDERLHHRTSRYTVNVAHHATQTDPCIVEHLVQSVLFSRKYPTELSTVAGQQSQFPQVPRGNETCSQETAPAQLSQPLTVANVGLSPRNLFDISGIHHTPFDSGLLQRGVDGFPENPGTFHHRQFDLLALEPVPQFFQFPMKRGEFPSFPGPFSNHGANHLPAVYVETRTTATHGLQHPLHPLPVSHSIVATSGRLFGSPCVALADKQVLLPYVLSQRDGTLGGTCRRAWTMLGLGDKQTTKLKARPSPLPPWYTVTRSRAHFHHWGEALPRS